MRIDPPTSFAWAIGTTWAATAAAAPPLEPPGVCSGFQGVPRRAEQFRLGGRADRKLGEVRLPDGDQPGASEAGRQFRVGVRDVAPEQGAALGERHPRDFRDEILHQKRHAGEGPVRERRVGLVAGPIEHAGDHRVQLAVHGFAAPDRVVDQLSGMDGAAADAIGQGGGVGVFQRSAQLSSEPGPSSIRSTLNSREANRQPASVFT